jgi:hypothetical protein
MDTVSLPLASLPMESTSLDMDSKRVSAIPAICAYRSRNDITVYSYNAAINGFVWTCIVGLSDRAVHVIYIMSKVELTLRGVLGAWDVLSG